MADTMYAWSPIAYDAEIADDGTKVKNLYKNVGEAVSAKDLGISDEDFEGLIEAGAVRKEKYPVPEEEQLESSPRQYFLKKAAEMEGEVSLGTGGSYFGQPDEALLAEVVEEPKAAEKKSGGSS